MKQALFIDRDGTILVEPADEQIDSFEKFQFVPGVIRNLNFIRTKLDFEFVMVSVKVLMEIHWLSHGTCR